ncbi:MAG: radical SAM protein [bacterium]
MTAADIPQICFDDELFMGLRLGYGEAFLKITRQCNNRCRFCCDRTFQDGHEYPVAQAVATLKQGRGHGLKNVVFSGGEPTVHSAFLELLEEAGRLGYERISVITNGRYFYYEQACWRAMIAGMTTAVITLLADEAETHDFLCGVPGAFEQSVTAVRNLVSLRPSLASVVITVTRPVVARLPRIVGFVRALGVGGVALHRVAPLPWVAADPEVFFEPEQARAPLREALVEVERLGLGLTVKNFPPNFLEGYEHLITESEEFFPEVRDTEKRLPLFRSQIDPALAPHCAELDCDTCYRQPFCEFLRSLNRCVRQKQYDALLVRVDVCGEAQVKFVERSDRPVHLRGGSPEQLEGFAWERGWLERVEGLELDEPASGSLRERWPALRTVTVAWSKGLAAFLKANATLEVVVAVNQATRKFVASQRSLLTDRDPAVVLALRNHERLRGVRKQELDLRFFFDRLGDEAGDGAGLTVQNLPLCLAPAATHRPRRRVLDVAVIGEDGELDPLEVCHVFLRDGWYDHSHRCEECRHRDGCEGLPLNQLTVFGYQQLEPIR